MANTFDPEEFAARQQDKNTNEVALKEHKSAHPKVSTLPMLIERVILLEKLIVK
ncbi:hypothetical protein UFOVP1155_12 [uncultured Caudovirales phage]|uniref:Uncharacterized protein n=1 Tax=uncultured Caudovirales phage TaxID=2100421 RepID=A0A6J5R1A2_9CAUD|nr:hypothetical protein UFOVP1155_12 [uncultured Caudovirales phage]